MTALTLTAEINGEQRTVMIDPSDSLLDVLRGPLGLTGTKRGCSEGECGACSVLVDGRVVNSCIYPAAKVQGRRVLTIEGLSTSGGLHPLQRAFIDLGAVQCGFCTPGMLMAAKAFLDGNSDPSESEVRLALSGNLCRCTGYAKIVKAVLSAAAFMRGELETPASDLTPGSLGHIGSSVASLDAVPKVTGTARYAGDLRFPGMLYVKVLRSPHPHADIVRLDCRRALAAEGVAAVVTAADVPGRNSFGIIVKDQPFLAGDRVRFVGEAVAAVAATTKEQAEAALSLIDVEYRPRPAVFDPFDALASDAPALFENGNVRTRRRVVRGDSAAAFAAADVVVEGTYRTQLVEHAYIEPEAGVAVFENGELVLHCVSQGVHYTRSEIAAMLGLPSNRVRVVQTTVGGGFGGKIEVSVHPFIALLAVKTGRPVRMVYTREESMLATTKRHPMTIDMRLGADREGRLLAGRARIVADTGAYTSYGPAVTTRAAVMAFGPYNVPNVDIESLAVHTNNPSAGAMRGFGVPQIAVAHEQLMDTLAEKVGLSPLEIRRLNGFANGNAVTPTGQSLDAGVGLLETLDRATKAFGDLGGGS